MSHNNSQSSFKVILTGALNPGVSLEEAEQRLSQLFHTTPDKVRHLLQGHSTVIKKNLDVAHVRKYQQALESVGVEFKIIENKPELSLAPMDKNLEIVSSKEKAPNLDNNKEINKLSALLDEPKKIDSGDPAIQFELGKKYYSGSYMNGKFLEKDESRGLDLIRSSANQGYKDAIDFLIEYEKKKASSRAEEFGWKIYKDNNEVLEPENVKQVITWLKEGKISLDSFCANKEKPELEMPIWASLGKKEYDIQMLFDPPGAMAKKSAELCTGLAMLVTLYFAIPQGCSNIIDTYSSSSISLYAKIGFTGFLPIGIILGFAVCVLIGYAVGYLPGYLIGYIIGLFIKKEFER